MTGQRQIVDLFKKKILSLSRRDVVTWSVFLLTPAFSYMIFEYTTGNLLRIGGPYLWLNLVFFYIFYLVLFTVSGSVRYSYLVLNPLLWLLAVAEYFVVLFRARPIMLWDIMAVRTAMTVSGNYTYELASNLLIGFGLILALEFLAWKFSLRISHKRRRLAAVFICLPLSGVFLAGFYQLAPENPGLDISMWNPVESYENMGFVLCTMRSVGYVEVKAPEGYSVKAVEEIYREIEEDKDKMELPWTTKDQVVPTNIICIMNESFSDLSVIGDFETDLPYLSYYHQLSENTIKGNLYVPVFGSMTSNTEFEFLTGNSMAFAPEGSVPYQVYMKPPVESLASSLKSQGYETIAMHPYPAENWNRDKAYRVMGFDQFLSEEYFEDSPLIRNYVSDRGNYEKIIQLTEKKEENQPLFIFNVTMQNHGGYNEDYLNQVHLTKYQDLPLTEQYLSLMRESDQALEYLLDYYSGIEEPTMVVMFGDHQPSIEEEFYEDLYQSPLSELSPKDYARRYITPFLVWTNYETPSAKVDQISSQYLSNLVIQRANLAMTDYQYFLEEMYRAAPVVHMMGYYNSDGVWESWTNWKTKKEYDIFQKLDILQYHMMFNKNKRNE